MKSEKEKGREGEEWRKNGRRDLRGPRRSKENAETNKLQFRE